MRYLITLAALTAGVAPQQTSQAELAGVGVFSTGAYELPPTFDLDGKRAYWTVSTPIYGRQRWIMESRLVGGKWSTPETPINPGPKVNSTATDYCPLVTPDGKYLYFSSTRGFVDKGPASKLSAAALRKQLMSPGNGLGDTYRVPMAEVRAIAGIKP